MTEDVKQQPTQVQALLPAIRDITIVATAFLYFTGFSFRYFYLTGLGVPPDAISIGLDSVLVYSFNVFLDSVRIILALGLIVILLWRRCASFWNAASVTNRRVTLVVLTVAAFGLLYALSVRSAANIDAEVRTGKSVFPRVVIALKHPKVYDQTIFGPAVNGTQPNVAAYLVGETESDLFILIQPDPLEGSKNIPGAYTYRIPRSDVDHYREDLSGVKR